MSFINLGLKRIDFYLKFSFVLILIASLLWTFISFSFEEILSKKIFSSTGPFVWLSCVLMFSGREQITWIYVKPVIKFIALVTAIMALRQLLLVGNSGNYVRYFSSEVRYMLILMWFGGWVFLSRDKSKYILSLVWIVPYLVFIVLAIYTRTRSWLLMGVIIFIVDFCFSNKSNRHIDKKQWIKNKLILSIYISMAIFSVLIFSDEIVGFFNPLADRALTDTRSTQYVEFFSQVSVPDLIFGLGPKATWVWGGEDYQYIDNGYIWIAFIGGMPMLVSYFLLIIFPGFKAFLVGGDKDIVVASILVILWGLACTGLSTYSIPSLSPYCFLLYLLAGRCSGALELSDAQKRKKYY